MSKQGIVCVVVYPFAGITEDGQLFRDILGIARRACEKPILVYDERCPQRDAQEALGEAESQFQAQVVRTRGVDTCQNWLEGWRVALGRPNARRIVLLPGDLQHVLDKKAVLSNVENFVKATSHDLILGNFKSIDPYSAKELIDVYGVFPLVANWFPEAWRCLRAAGIEKPRSEFLNLSVGLLRKTLKDRAFAYEQTLNMLIRTWYSCKQEAHGNLINASDRWRKTVTLMEIGAISDAPSGRSYAGAIDQIERTERLLRTLWRELEEWRPSANESAFMDDVKTYEDKDERSTAIRNAGRIAIWALLGVSNI